MLLVGNASNGREAIEFFKRHRPDITLMDLRMPEMDGIDAISAIREEFSSARIVVLTTYTGDALARRAFRAGAAGFLLKTALRRELVDTIRAVHSGQRKISPEIAAQLAEHYAQDVLTDRELEVLRRVAVGLSNKAVAAQLRISDATVKAHLKSVLLKLGASDRTHAVTIAMRRGFLAA